MDLNSTSLHAQGPRGFSIGNRDAFLAEDSLTDGNCKLTPERMEGPFYLQEELFRANLTENEPGVPLLLRINVTDPDCNPLANAFVDIWQCNSTGFYSGFTGETHTGL